MQLVNGTKRGFTDASTKKTFPKGPPTVMYLLMHIINPFYESKYRLKTMIFFYLKNYVNFIKRDKHVDVVGNHSFIRLFNLFKQRKQNALIALISVCEKKLLF